MTPNHTFNAKRLALQVSLLASGLLASAGGAWASAPNAAVHAATPSVFATGGGVSVSRVDMDAEVQRLPAQAKPTVVVEPSSLEVMAKNLYLRRALSRDAEAAGVERDERVAAALRLARERVLSEVWVERTEAAAVPDAATLETYARTAYRADASRFAEPEQWRARHILIAAKTDEADGPARDTAQKLLDELKAGADFESLARTHSQDPGSGAKGGDLGFFERGRMVKPFEEAVVALREPGALSGLVRSEFGYHIIRLEEHKPAGVRPFEEVKAQLVGEAEAKLRQAARQRTIEAALKDVQVDGAAVEALADHHRASQPAQASSAPAR